VALTTPRRYPRIVPTSPLTVSIEDDSGLRMGYGVITNVSLGGACVFTDSRFLEGSLLRLRLSFCQPPEVHEVSGVVIWERSGEGNRDTPTRRLGVEWRETPPACEQRLRALVCDAEEETLAPSSLIALRSDLVEH
jgi:hypothetical protein